VLGKKCDIVYDMWFRPVHIIPLSMQRGLLSIKLTEKTGRCSNHYNRGPFFLLSYSNFVRVKGLIASVFSPTLCQGVPRRINRGVLYRRPELYIKNRKLPLLN